MKEEVIFSENGSGGRGKDWNRRPWGHVEGQLQGLHKGEKLKITQPEDDWGGIRSETERIKEEQFLSEKEDNRWASLV